MRLAFGVVAVLSVFVEKSADAQPCSVNIAHAPDDVREVVEQWVAGEAQCRPDLEVRIVPTDGGYYLFARDGAGQVRERIVPDAQSAGVLVASWVADDGVTSLPPPSPMQHMQEAPPGAMTPAETPASVVAKTAEPKSQVQLALGATFGSFYGVRGDLDALHRGRLLFGLSISADAARLDGYVNSFYNGTTTLRDLGATAYVASVLRRDVFWMRFQVGAGVITSEFNGGITGMEQTGGDTAALFESSIRLGVDLGSWTVSAGPLARYYHQQWSSDDFSVSVGRDGDISVYAGIGRRL